MSFKPIIETSITGFLTSCVIHYGDPNIIFIHQKYLVLR